MPESQIPITPPSPFEFDAQAYSKLFENFQGSFRNYANDRSLALDRCSDINKQISAFYERLLLLNGGTIGLSLSALISFASKYFPEGSHKVIILVLVSLGWVCLLSSAMFCSMVMSSCLAANRKLVQDWSIDAAEFDAEVIATNTRRLSTALKGSIQIDGENLDASEYFLRVANSFKKKFTEKQEEQLKTTVASIVDNGKHRAGRYGVYAIRLMQIGLLLLGMTAITLCLGI